MIAILLSPIYIILNVYILVRLIKYFGVIHERLRHPVIWTLSIVIYVFFMTTPLTGFLIRKEPFHHILKALSNYWLGVLEIGLVILLVFDLLRLILNRTIWKDDHPNERRFRIWGTCGILIIILMSTYGSLHSKKIEVKDFNLEVDKAMAGNMKIALVADMHIGYSVGADHMKQMVDKINGENPDIVIFAGDIFDNEYEAIREPEKITKIFKSIKSKYGTYACWGNHDISERLLAGFTIEDEDKLQDDVRFEKLLEDSDITLLQDERLLIDDKFYLVGREDPSRSKKLKQDRKSIEKLTEGIDKNKPLLVMDHQPSELEELEKAGVDIDLSGHTHNGQTFPGNFFIGLAWDNAYGVEKLGDMYSCVTSGVGVWGPAMRVGTDCEIMMLNVNFK